LNSQSVNATAKSWLPDFVCLYQNDYFYINFIKKFFYFFPLFVCTEFSKNSLLKKSNEPTKPTRALLRAWRTDINNVRLPTVAGYY
jgi:hypothetical protein